MAGTETALPDYPRGITFEQVWAALMEDRKRNEELRIENDRRKIENDRIIQEMREESRRLSERMGNLHNRFGELAEHLVAPGIAGRFNEIGYHFDSMAAKGVTIYDEQKKIRAEIDLLLENGNCLMAVEVKTRPTEKDILHHARRLEILRDYREQRQEKPKRILGAIAGAVFPGEPQRAAIEAGLYVIEQSGDTMRINVPDGFKPREW